MFSTIRIAAVVAATFLLVACSPATHSVATTRSDTSALREQYLRAPMAFERNVGQAGSDADFFARGPGYTVLLNPTQAVFALHANASSADQIRMAIRGGDPTAVGYEEERQIGTSNYFRGGRQDITNVPHAGRVHYRNVYPGIDVVYYGNQHQLEYDFVVAPGADPRPIAMDFSGVRGLRLNATGDLLLMTAHGDVVQHKPLIYQIVDGKRHPIDGGYRLLADNRVGFVVGRYDESAPLVLDPIIVYASYFGGSGEDVATTTATDAYGNLYVAGYTQSLDFPVASGAQPASHGGSDDLFVAKFDADNDTLLYSTYLGGSGDEHVFDMAVDATGNVYLAGSTTSVDFPVKAALQPQHGADGGQDDGFIAKLAPAGNALLFSTYLGGSTATDEVYAIDLDASGAIWVAGHTQSTDFPTHSPLQATNHGSDDGFVSKLAGNGSSLLYSTYLGGSSADLILGLDVDASGRAHVAGETFSTDFPLVSPLQGALSGQDDAFLATLASTGSTLDFSTYLGGEASDMAFDIAVDSNGNRYVVGRTRSSHFLTVNPSQPTLGGGSDGFVARVTANNAFGFSTYFGGSQDDEVREVSMRGPVADVTGFTHSSDFPLVNALQSQFNRGNTAPSSACATTPCADAVIAEFGYNGERRISSYLGGAGDDFGWAIANYGRGTWYVAGMTTSSDLHTSGAARTTPAGAGDAFVSRLGVRGWEASDVNDFDGDYSTDVLWRNSRTGANAIWLGSSSGRSTPVATAAASWSAVAVADFNCDLKSDILWRNSSTGANAIWLSGNAATPMAIAGVSNLDWQVAGVADFNTCRQDIIWHNRRTGANVVWSAANASAPATRGMSTVSNLAWDIAGVGDFDGDGVANDVLWHNHSTNASVVWKDGMSSSAMPIATVTNLDWKIVGIGDFRGDAVTDILWRNARTGASVIWISGNSALQQPVTAITNLAWQVAAIGDYNGDGRSDILWRNRTTGANVIWRSASSTHQQAVTGVSNPDWSVVP